MDDKEEEIDKLIEELRVELSSIVAEDASVEQKKKKPTTTAKRVVPDTAASKKVPQPGGAKGARPKVFGTKRANRVVPGVVAEPPTERGGNPQPADKPVEDESEKALKAAFVNSHGALAIDADLQRMQAELQESYNLFQTINEKLEGMTFLSLPTRIKELNLSQQVDSAAASGGDGGPVDDAEGASGVGDGDKRRIREELNHMLDKGYVKERLESMTKEMGKRMQQHPGEFGDIPEVSTFLSSATQLERGLKRMEKQRGQVDDLSQRMCWATNISCERIEEINKLMKHYESLAEQMFD